MNQTTSFRARSTSVGTLYPNLGTVSFFESGLEPDQNSNRNIKYLATDREREA